MQFLEDNHYIKLTRQGDMQAFGMLVQKHQRLVYTLALRMLKNPEEAQEAAQDTFVKVYQSLPGFEGKSKFTTWMYRVVYNECLGRLRKSKRHFTLIEDLMENMSSKRREGGAELRASVHAPPGHSLIIADLSQIEARINAWFCKQENMVEAFRAYDAKEGPDVYRYTAATSIYNKHVDLITDEERFLGKACVLALGFQAGAARFAGMLRIGALGPPIEITDSLAKDIHSAWRSANPFIVANWRATNQKVKQAFLGCQTIEDGVVSYQGVKDPRTKQIKGWMHLPGGMAIRYDDVQIDSNGKDYSYIGEYRRNKVKPPTIKRVKLYGGIEVENRTQALARKVITEHMIGVVDELKKNVRIAMSTHDEIVGVVPNRWAKKALGVFKEVMSQPVDWAPGLPIAVDAHISSRYDK